MRNFLPTTQELVDNNNNVTHHPDTLIPLGGDMRRDGYMIKKDAHTGWNLEMFKLGVKRLFKSVGEDSIDKIPELYETDGSGGKEKVWITFWVPFSDAVWHITEIDQFTGECFGFASLFSDGISGELGYFTLEDIATYSFHSGTLPVMENYTEGLRHSREEVVFWYKRAKTLI